jgi:hypothetical protein
MNLLFTALLVIGIIVAALLIGLLVLWLKGFGSFLFPAAGFVVTMPVLIILFSLIEIVFVLIAMLVGQQETGSNVNIVRF